MMEHEKLENRIREAIWDAYFEIPSPKPTMEMWFNMAGGAKDVICGLLAKLEGRGHEADK